MQPVNSKGQELSNFTYHLKDGHTSYWLFVCPKDQVLSMTDIRIIKTVGAYLRKSIGKITPGLNC